MPAQQQFGTLAQEWSRQARERNAELRHTETLYRTIVETAREGVWICDVDGLTVFTNQRMADMLGYTQEEMLGQPVFAFMESDADRAYAKAEIGQKVVGQREFKYRRKDGSRLWTILEISVMHGEDGKPEGMCAMVTDISERKVLEEELNRQTLHDPLTGLANRMLLNDRLEQALRRGERQATFTAVLFLDLDGFKDVNDTYGHPTGDALLVAVADLLREALRSSDSVARVGGDEFVVVSESFAGASEARSFAERLCASMAEPLPIGGLKIDIRVSIGIAIGKGSDQADVLLRNADLAMYQAKVAGGGRVHVFDQKLRARVDHQRRMQVNLARGIGRGELRVVYQPVVALVDERIVGAEALVRWQHPEQGLLQPAEFIPLAEESGLIGELDEWVLEQACRQLVLWHQAGLDHLSVAVNLSAQEFGDPHLTDHVMHTLRATGADPRHLVVEITETAVMTDVDASASILHSLRAMGVTVAIDDFGTGRSSLAYLKQFPIDTLKIDRSFIQGLGIDDQDTSIVGAIIAMAHALGLTTLAEGVERPEQLRALRALGCELAQGFRWASPLQPDEFSRRTVAERAARAARAGASGPPMLVGT